MQPGGFAILPVPLLKIWHLLPAHHAKILPLLLSFGPGDMFPKQRRLAALAGCSRKAVNETLGQMVDSGLLLARQTWREKDGARSTVKYNLADLDDETTRGRI